MSENTAEATETAAEEQQETPPQPQSNELPADHPLVKTLDAQKATIKELKAKAKRLDDLEEAQKTESQRLTERADTEFARAEAAEAELVRYKVATEKGIPVNAMKFLVGTTREEIEASAKDVLELIGDAGKPRAPKPDPNQGRTSSEATNPASQFASFIHDQLNSA